MYSWPTRNTTLSYAQRLAIADTQVVDINGIRIPIIGRAHLIANKRAVGRPQNLADADLVESAPG